MKNKFYLRDKKHFFGNESFVISVKYDM